MSQRIKAAALFAAAKHQDQKYGETHAYTRHLYDVSKVLERFKFLDEDLQVAAWLHDTVEDTTATVDEIMDMFGINVADIVQRVTNEPGVNRKARHALTYPKIQASDDATTLKLADRIANVEFSIENESSQLEMYTKEHTAFKKALYKPGVHDAMWRHLDFLIGEIFDPNNILGKLNK